jgi:hypothetical protein
MLLPLLLLPLAEIPVFFSSSTSSGIKIRIDDSSTRRWLETT